MINSHPPLQRLRLFIPLPRHYEGANKRSLIDECGDDSPAFAVIIINKDEGVAGLIPMKESGEPEVVGDEAAFPTRWINIPSLGPAEAGVMLELVSFASLTYRLPCIASKGQTIASTLLFTWLANFHLPAGLSF